MKKTKVLLILFLILFLGIMPLARVDAHSVVLDPNSFISFPFIITNGNGTITIANSQTGYTLYYQSVEMSDNDYDEMQETKDNGKKELEAIKAELDEMQEECNNLKEAYDEAKQALEEKNESGASEEEITEAEEALETAETNFLNRTTDYNNKVKEYNNKVKEINENINALIPEYDDTKWIITEDGSFEIDVTQFSGKKVFVLWAKLVTSDGTISYDEEIYTISGTKSEKIAVESIKLDKSSLNMTEGSTYTLVATITPSDATNKSVIWSSDNENVAKVENGKVTAVSEGTATITAKTEDGEHIDTCKVTVTKKTVIPSDSNNNKPDTTVPDSTVANTELPKAGSLTYIIILAILGISIIGVITYRKVKYLNFK